MTGEIVWPGPSLARSHRYISKLGHVIADIHSSGPRGRSRHIQPQLRRNPSTPFIGRTLQSTQPEIYLSPFDRVFSCFFFDYYMYTLLCSGEMDSMLLLLWLCSGLRSSRDEILKLNFKRSFSSMFPCGYTQALIHLRLVIFLRFLRPLLILHHRIVILLYGPSLSVSFDLLKSSYMVIGLAKEATPNKRQTAREREGANTWDWDKSSRYPPPPQLHKSTYMYMVVCTESPRRTTTTVEEMAQ